MLILPESRLNLHAFPYRNRTRTLSVVVYLTAEENVSNPSEISLYFINFYSLELELAMTGSSILLITIQN